MDNSILRKLPTEIRLNIYEEVLKGAKITISIHNSSSEEEKATVTYKFSSGCSLAITCRDIKIESAETMWRGAFVKILTDDDDNLSTFIQELTQLLPNEVTRNISHLSKIAFPNVDELVEQHSLEKVTSSFLNFPNLEVCIVPSLNIEDKATISHIDGVNVEHNILEHHENRHESHWDQELALFEVGSGTEPNKFLEEIYGIGTDCNVQILSQQRLVVCYRLPPLEYGVRIASIRSSSKVRCRSVHIE